MRYFIFSLLFLTCCHPIPKPSVELDQAIQAAQNAIETPSVRNTIEQTAQQALAQGNNKRAITYYQQLTQDDPANLSYRLGLAESYRKQLSFNEAITHYNTILQKDPYHIGAMEGKALCLIERGEYDTAQALLEQLLAKDASRWKTISAYGIQRALDQQYDQAIEYLQLALEVSPNNPVILNNMGLVFAQESHFSQAIDHLQQAKTHSRNSNQREHIDRNLALIYGLSGKMEKASELLATQMEDAAIYNNLGIYAKLANDPELSKSYLHKALNSHPSYYERAAKNLSDIPL